MDHFRTRSDFELQELLRPVAEFNAMPEQSPAAIGPAAENNLTNTANTPAAEHAPVITENAPAANKATSASKKRKSTPTEDNKSDNSTSPKRKCKPNACNGCRKSHITCGGNVSGTSACEPCTKKGVPCEYGTDDRTNDAKRDELLRKVKIFKENVGDYYITICAMIFYIGSSESMDIGAQTAALALKQCGTILPKTICELLESDGFGPVYPPAGPDFCIEATIKACDGSKLKDTRSAIRDFQQKAQQYIEKMHTVYRMIGDSCKEDDAIFNKIIEILGRSRDFLVEDFDSLQGLDTNPDRFIKPNEIPNLDEEFIRRSRSSSISSQESPRDLTPDQSPGEEMLDAFPGLVPYPALDFQYPVMNNQHPVINNQHLVMNNQYLVMNNQEAQQEAMNPILPAAASLEAQLSSGQEYEYIDPSLLLGAGDWIDAEKPAFPASFNMIEAPPRTLGEDLQYLVGNMNAPPAFSAEEFAQQPALPAVPIFYAESKGELVNNTTPTVWAAESSIGQYDIHHGYDFDFSDLMHTQYQWGQ